MSSPSIPAKQDHTLAAASDARTPRALHPAFYGSFDWHSCVHMHWSLARLRRLFPALPERAAIGRVFDAHLDATTIAAELDYLTRPASASFERPYGWAWLLELARELGADDDPDASAGPTPWRRSPGIRVPLPRLAAARRLSDPLRHARERRVRALVRHRLRARGRRRRARARCMSRALCGSATIATRRRLGAVRRGLPVAVAGGGRPDAPRAAARPLRRLARRLPAGPCARRARNARSPPRA
jgi:hypothetical protein